MADDIIASARSMTNVTDNQYVTIGMPKASLTPATLTAMAGMAQGGALQVSKTTQNIIGNLQSQAASVFGDAGGNAAILSAAGVNLSVPSANVAGDIAKLTANAATLGVTISSAQQAQMSNIMSASSTLNTLTSKMMPAGNPAAFGKFLAQAQSHITDSIEIKKATAFISSTNVSDFGSGVKDMASMADRGLTNSLGSLTGAAGAVGATGTMFAGGSTKNFGQPAGVVEALNQNKLGNATGVNAALKAAGVPLDDVSNPVYAEQVKTALTSVKDPTAISVIAKQFNIMPPAGTPGGAGDSLIQSFKGFSGIQTKMSPSAITGALQGAIPNLKNVSIGNLTKDATKIQW